MPDSYLSVDLGGTSLRMGLLDKEGTFLAQQVLSSDLVRKGGDLIKVLSQEAELFRFRAEKIDVEIRGMALGIPGLVDRRRGVVRQSPHFPEWRDIPLREALQPALPFPVVMENDANQAALGEAWKGAGREWPSFILLTLGTGVGGGVIVDGKIFHGPNGFAGEVGHIVLERRGLPGALGSRGTLETLASQSGLRLQLESLQKAGGLPAAISGLNPADPDLPEKLFQAASVGESVALEIWREFGAALGCGIASLGLAFGFERFIVGGGLSAAWRFFEKGLREEIRERVYPCLAERMEAAPAKLGNNAGLLGGIRLLQTAQSTSCSPP